VIQNNVSNADSPSFARQRLSFFPRPLDIRGGLAGGVDAGPLVSYRDSYSERNVWRQNHAYGRQSQTVADLEQIEPAFSITAGSGVAGALNNFFNSVSSWSVNPNDPVARQVVLDRADYVARQFNQNATELGSASFSADRQIRATADRINSLGSTIRDYVEERQSDVRKRDDPGLDASIHAALEELAELVDFNVVEEPDGGLQVLMGGQHPLVIGDRHFPVSVDFSFAQPQLLNSTGKDITADLSEGSLKGLFDTRNTLIPSYQAGLNELAQAFADRVNNVLAGGLDTGGANPTQDLFTYDITAGAAQTLAVNPLDPSQLAAAEAGAPSGNGNALRLAALADSNEVGGVTFNEFYGELSAQVGRDLSRARDSEQIQGQLLSQARELRADRSGVSLDEEAARLIEAQRAYQANAQLFSVLNSLTDTLINLLQ
jgi:flagellar hook-associated protein 1 FlgK